jgi:hypothetical protein
MAHYLIKLFLSAGIIVLASEISKRSTLAGGVLVSLPITSILAMIWLYRDTGEAVKAAELATSVLWLVLPSLILFAVFPWMIGRGFGFYQSLATGCLATAGGYWVTIELVQRLLK